MHLIMFLGTLCASSDKEKLKQKINNNNETRGGTLSGAR